MNDIVNTIRKLSDSKKNEDIDELSRKLDGVGALKKQSVDALDQALSPNILSVSHHTLGYLTLLYYKGLCFGDVLDHMDRKQLAGYAEQAHQLMMNGDGYQIRKGGKKFAVVCKRYREVLLVLGATMSGILPLRRALEKARGSDKHVLTVAHSEFVLCCIKSHNYRAALPVLDVPIYSINPDENGLQPVDFLTYHYYGAMAFTALKQFEQALEMFQIALTCPGNVLSAVQLASYKKYVLLCLLVHDEFVSLPSVVSRTVTNHCEKLCSPYMDLAKAYKKGSGQVVKVVEQHTEAYIKDQCFGLVKQVLNSQTRRKIQKLTNTYITLSLSDIAQSANLETPLQAEEHVLDMVNKGDIFAKINKKDGMLSFLEDPEEYNTHEMVAKMDSKIRSVMSLAGKLQELNNNTLLNPLTLKMEVVDIQSDQRREQNKQPQQQQQGGGGSMEDMQMRNWWQEESLRHQ